MSSLQSVNVKIGGQEYKLRSDDEAKVRHLAEKVDVKIQHLRHKIKEPSTTALTVLTALNIAEEGYELEQRSRFDLEYLSSELEQMGDFLAKSAGESS